MQSDVHEVEPNAAHVLFTQWPFFRCPLESTVYVLLDLVQILYSLCHINHEVCSVCFGTVAPYLATGILIPIILLPQPLVSFFLICLGTKATLLDVTAYFLLQWF